MHCLIKLEIMLVLILWKQFSLQSLIHIQIMQTLHGGKTQILS